MLCMSCMCSAVCTSYYLCFRSLRRALFCLCNGSILYRDVEWMMIDWCILLLLGRVLINSWLMIGRSVVGWLVDWLIESVAHIGQRSLLCCYPVVRRTWFPFLDRGERTTSPASTNKKTRRQANISKIKEQKQHMTTIEQHRPQLKQKTDTMIPAAATTPPVALDLRCPQQ